MLIKLLQKSEYIFSGIAGIKGFELCCIFRGADSGIICCYFILWNALAVI
jgi:hypothetical protein